MHVGKTYKIIDLPQADPCERCSACMRLRLMEMGFYPGQKINLLKHQYGIWVVCILSETGHGESHIALREEELKRIIIEESL
jgi:Fe2+ transport system protein FeoA